MAADLNQLVPEFKPLVETLLTQCAQRGVEMRPYFTLRDPFEQARLWRQSRATEEIRAKIAEFENGGADFLAHCLRSVGPQYGDHVTDAPPGFSWHQWGEAVDCFWFANGKAQWSTQKKVNGVNGYRVYTKEAKNLGLTAGGNWTTLKDWPHVQFRAAGHPGRVMSLADINRTMKERFGG
jgi:hypothetical protein